MAPAYNTDYETVAASQTDQVLGPSGKKGDILEILVIVPESTSPGEVAIQDGNGTAITVFAGGASSVTSLTPINLAFGARSKIGAWSVTTGADVSVLAIGGFT
jgi:hypothetical protein